MSHPASLALYILCILGSTLLLYIGIKYRILLLRAIALIIPIIVSGLRIDVGTDYQSYVRMYSSLSNVDIGSYLSNITIEPLFYGLIKISSVINSDPVTLFILSAVLTIGTLYMGMCRLQLRHPALFYLLYLVIIFPITFNAMRQGIAVSIAFLAFSYLIKHKKGRFITFGVIAGLFHISAILLFAFYYFYKVMYLNNKSTGTRTIVTLYLTIALIAIALPGTFLAIPHTEQFAKYLDYGNYVSGVSLTMIIFKLSVLLTILYFYPRIEKNDVAAKQYLILGSIEYTTAGLWLKSAALFRITYILTPFNLILLSDIVEAFKNGRSRAIAAGLIVAFAVVYFIVAYYLAGQAEIFPYNFYEIG